MNFLAKKWIYIFLAGCFSILISCSELSEIDDYKKYAEGGEISYTGKIDSLQMFPGKNRIKIRGLIISDPKVSEVRVYWNGGKDSLTKPLERTGGIDAVTVTIDNLNENIYNFEFRTFDDLGNSSIPVFETGSVYGERYQQSLSNRPVTLNELVENNLSIEFAEMDRNTGVIGTEIEYTSTNDSEQTIFVPIDSTSTFFDDFSSGSTYSLRTVFLPEPNAIDTFYTPYQTYIPIPTPVLKNASVPFHASAIDGRWGILDDPWLTNEAVKIHNGHGGWDEWNGNIFNVESGWGAPAITNGKIYQVVEVVQPSTFVLNVNILNTNHQPTDEGGAYFIVVKGEGLPDVEELESSPEILGYKRVLESSPRDYKVEFTIQEPNQIISVGYLTTQADGWPGRFANITSWKITPKN